MLLTHENLVGWTFLFVFLSRSLFGLFVYIFLHFVVLILLFNRAYTYVDHVINNEI